MRIKKYFLRQYIKLLRWLNKKEYVLVDHRELKAKAAAIHLINDPNSILKICPETGKKYIDNKARKISIIINSHYIEFFGDYLYIVYFSQRNYEAVVKVFDKHASADRQALENKIRSNVTQSFDDLYNELFN